MQPTHKPVTFTVTPSRVLRDAAMYLDRYGWVQGSYFDQSATVFTPAACIVGAIGMVCYGGPVETPAQHFDDPGFPDFEAAVAWLEQFLARLGLADVYTFNDTKGLDVASVLLFLHVAADLWDRKHLTGPASVSLTAAGTGSHHLAGVTV